MGTKWFSALTCKRVADRFPLVFYVVIIKMQHFNSFAFLKHIESNGRALLQNELDKSAMS